MRWSWIARLGALALLAGCRAAAPPAPPMAPPPAPALVPAPDTVWTGGAMVEVRGEDGGGPTPLPRPFTRLQVIGADSARLRVRCTVCPDTVQGWVARGDVIHQPPPADSLAGATPAQFALAMRRAVAARDLTALYPLLSTDFSFSPLGAFGRDLALASWTSENYRTLDRVPELLDRGLSRLGEQWVAPPEYASQHEYRPLRLGFQRSPAGRWEWVFLMRGEMEP